MPTRRDFLTTLGVALGAASLGCARALEAEDTARQLPRVGLQLYTVRDLMAKDVEGTLARVAAIGYKEVEFAGYFGRTPTQIRNALRANGLTSPSSHIPMPANDDGWKRACEDAKAIGHEWAVLPWLDPGARKEWGALADRFNSLAAITNGVGLRFAYHNHDFEFARVGNGTALDLLLQKTDPKLVDFEMDLYWVVKGGGDPLDFFNRYPHRFPLMHAKDSTPAPAREMTDVGSGTINFGAIFARQAQSGMKHVYVERDSGAEPVQSIKNSYQYLKALRF
ncbi:MAG: sugar phosphate isomerase/epimerase [bacterium]